MSRNYQSYVGLDAATARAEIGFPIQRESLISEKTHTGADRDLLIRADTGHRIGIIPKTHNLVAYGDIVDWATGQFDQVGTDYKLRESVITNNGDLYQEYLFDYDITSPDGEDISPLAIMKASYTGIPLQIIMGTYRFVCLNGVIVGDTISEMRVSAHNSHSILPSSIKDQLTIKLAEFSEVAAKYQDLYATPYDMFLNLFLASELIPMLMKKAVFYQMQQDGNIKLTVDKLKQEHLFGSIEDVYNILQEQTAWYLYNIATQYATHQARSVNSRMLQYQGISKVFGI